MATNLELVSRSDALVAKITNEYAVQPREARAIVERLLMTLVNAEGSLIADTPYHRDANAEEKFFKEIWEKCKKQKGKRRLYIERLLSENPRRKAVPRAIEGPRVEKFRADHGEDALCEMQLRYQAFAHDGGQWGVPSIIYKKLIAAGANAEGFASPLNSRMRGIPGCVYHSAFDDEERFGSKGSFFKNAEPSRVYTVNPPYAEPIMERAVDVVLAQDIRGMVMLPKWEDTPAYTKLITAGWTPVQLPRGHLLEKAEGAEFRAPWNETIFVHPEMEKILKVVEEWAAM